VEETILIYMAQLQLVSITMEKVPLVQQIHRYPIKQLRLEQQIHLHPNATNSLIAIMGFMQKMKQLM
jgi:hypothetical protein